MTVPASDRRLLRRLAWTGASLAFGLIVLGGVVRITGSGLGCGEHWPNCNGQWFPPLDLPTAIEISHRWVAALVSIMVIAVAATAWIRHRQEPALRGLGTAALVLLIIQVLLGAVTVKLTLPPWVVITHLANAMILLGVLVVLALRCGPAGDHSVPAARHTDHRLVYLTAGIGMVVILFGAETANFNAGLLCLGFPLCNNQLLPPANHVAGLHWTHRMLAFTFLAFVIATVARIERGYRAATARGAAGTEYRWLRLASWTLLVVTVGQIGVAAAMVLNLLPPALRVLHLLVGTAVWVSLVVLVFRSSRTPAPALEAERDAAAPVGYRKNDPAPRPTVARDLVTLTKPRIISLLLVTTIAPMFITPAGWPSLAQIMWVTVGGYLMAGGANAINMWWDRDIDTRMGRTKLRPIPSGRIPAPLGLGFGLLLAALSFTLFWFYVNPLSAWLALTGLLFYVFIYTMWLKRTSTQNIVIGGAAGAFPPLVGWAAMTGRLDLAAIYLFAIIFYWTPPHFWALALIKRAEYAKAGIPMMPVVRGEQRTKVEMLIYSLLLLPLTLMPAAFGAMGLFYAAAAALLGARLVWYCIKLLREQSVTPTAWRLYKYSLLYLALLFVAMGVDRVVPFGHGGRPAHVYILRHPDAALPPPKPMPVAQTAPMAH